MAGEPDVSDNLPAGIFEGIAHDVAVQVLARVPRRDYAGLRLVSKAWKSTIDSCHLYDQREKLGRTEHWLYVLMEEPQGSPFSVYDPASDKWHQIPLMPGQARGSYIPGFACAAVGRKLLVMGGRSKGESVADVRVYDPITNRWSLAAPMNAARSDFTCGVIGGSVYVAGGLGSQAQPHYLRSAEVYHAEEDRWEPVASMSVARSSHHGAVMGGEFWVIAGERAHASQLRGSAEAFDPEQGVWRTVPDMWPEVHLVPSPSAVLEGVLYMAHHGKIMAYDPASSMWRRRGDVSCSTDASRPYPAFVRRRFGCAALGPRLCVFGGFLAPWERQSPAFSYRRLLGSLESCYLREEPGAEQSRAEAEGEVEGCEHVVEILDANEPKLRWHAARVGPNEGAVLGYAVLAL